MTRIAYVAADGQVRAVRPDGQDEIAVTYPDSAGASGASWGAGLSAETRTWPCWSPDGRWVACFVHPRGEDAPGPMLVSAVQVDGVEERQLVQLSDQLPVYCQWSPSGDRLAVISQIEDELQLWVTRLDQQGERRVIDEGAPLFFSWTEDGQRLLVHAGSRQQVGARLVERDWGPDGQDRVLAGRPGAFCTPLQVAKHDVYGVMDQGGTVVRVAPVGGGAHRELLTLPGLVAIVAAPEGDRLAVANAPAGEGAPYQGLWIVPLDGAAPRQLSSDPCLSFHWVPGGAQIIVAAWEGPGAPLEWRLVDLDSGQWTALGRFLPTRDQLFREHFFEQFAISHPLVSADGRWFTYAAHPTPTGRGDVSPHVMVVDLRQPALGPRELAMGSFGVFSPTP